MAETRPDHGIRCIALHLVLYLLAQPSTMSLSHLLLLLLLSSYPSWRGTNAPVEHWSNGTTTKRKAKCLFSLAAGHSSTSGNVERDSNLTSGFIIKLHSNFLIDARSVWQLPFPVVAFLMDGHSQSPGHGFLQKNRHCGQSIAS